MTKLLVLAPAYSPSTGGVEKHILMLVRELVKRGYDIQILVRYATGLPEHQIVEGAEVWRLPESNSLPALAWWYATHRSVFAGVTVVHSHDFYPRHLRRLLKNVRWVHTFHGYEGWPLDPGAIASRQLVRAEVPVCIGVGKFIEKWYGTTCDYLIYGAAEAPGAVKAAADGAEIVFVGRLEQDTGIEVYLRGFKLIHDQHPEVRMAILGDGSLRTGIEQYVEDNSLPVTLLGWRGNTLPYLKSARLVFAAGYLAILEAALMARPVIAQYTTPIKKDYLECHPLADNFFIVQTPEEIAAAYHKAIKADSAKVAASQTWAQKQTWAAVAELYDQQYQGAS